MDKKIEKYANKLTESLLEDLFKEEKSPKEIFHQCLFDKTKKRYILGIVDQNDYLEIADDYVIFIKNNINECFKFSKFKYLTTKKQLYEFKYYTLPSFIEQDFYQEKITFNKDDCFLAEIKYFLNSDDLSFLVKKLNEGAEKTLGNKKQEIFDYIINNCEIHQFSLKPKKTINKINKIITTEFECKFEIIDPLLEVETISNILK